MTCRGVEPSSVRFVHRAIRRARLDRPGATRPCLRLVASAAHGPRRAGRRAFLACPGAARRRQGVSTITAPGACLVVRWGPFLVLRVYRLIRGGTRMPRRIHTLHALRPLIWRLERSHLGGATPARFIQRREATSGCWRTRRRRTPSRVGPGCPRCRSICRCRRRRTSKAFLCSLFGGIKTPPFRPTNSFLWPDRLQACSRSSRRSPTCSSRRSS